MNSEIPLDGFTLGEGVRMKLQFAAFKCPKVLDNRSIDAIDTVEIQPNSACIGEVDLIN